MTTESANDSELTGSVTALARGSSQAGVRLYNERLVLSLIRKYGSLPKAELAKLTKLSAQTVSVIVRSLEAEGLLIKERPQRGKVGQPLVPFSLNPEGAFAIGLKVGRRSGDLMLLDLAGTVRHSLHEPYHFPAPSQLLAFVRSGIETLVSTLSPPQQARISGLGIAAPFELWNWGEEVGAARSVLDSWRNVDLAAEITKLVPWPVHFCNDATAACAAELLFGRGARLRDLAYFFIGYFVGGGIVINGNIFQGRSGYAGAFGSLPVPGSDGRPHQLIHQASLYVLENHMMAAGLDPMLLARSPHDWGDIGPALDLWLDQTADSLAHAAAAVMAVVEFEAVIIDGAMPPAVRGELVRRTQAALDRHDLRGLTSFMLEEGTIGSTARAMGAASLPLFANFIVDRDVLFKEFQ